MGEREGISAGSDHIPADDVPRGMLLRMSDFVGQKTTNMARSSKNRIHNMTDANHILQMHPESSPAETKKRTWSGESPDIQDVQAAAQELDLSRIDQGNLGLAKEIWRIADKLDATKAHGDHDPLLLLQIIIALQDAGKITEAWAVELIDWIQHADRHKGEAS